MNEPRQKPGLSRQDFGTPRPFLDAVERKWGTITLDLCAHQDNHVVPAWFGPGGIAEDSLATPWPTSGVLWLNPPFGDIAPWAEKSAAYRGSGVILMLTPASVGTNWFAAHVHKKALVLALSGRLSFDGKAPYPKDLMLVEYNRADGFDVWDWRKT